VTHAEAQTPAPRRPRARRGEGAKLAAEILDAASALLAEVGHPDAVSINDVIRAVGCSPPALYLHYPSKQALFLAVVERHFAGFRQAINAAAEGKSPLEGLHARGLAYVEWGLAHPEAYRIIFLHSPLQDPDPVVGEHSAGALADHVEAVQRCIDAGLFPGGDAAHLALALWAAVHGLTSLLITKPNVPWPDPAELASLITQAAGIGLDAVLRGDLQPGEHQRRPA
jgi:AcrR family transcriptional regulator